MIELWLCSGVDLPRVVFFGRSGEEACRFFNLDLSSWQGSTVLDCPGGPCSFTAVARRHGVEVVAVDPLHDLPPEQLELRCREDVQFTMERLALSDALRPDFDLGPYRQEKLQALELFR
jgi:hypothetical protein